MKTSTLPHTSNGRIKTVADLVHRLGDIPLERIRMNPLPGTATEKDLIALCDGANKTLCELVDGTLVEKPVGAVESFLAARLIFLFGQFLARNELGAIFGADAPFRVLRRRVRLPDVSFVSWEKFPDREVPSDKIAVVIPDLVVEVISTSNTRKEMKLKLRDYFQAGVRQAWLIYPKSRTAEIYTAPNRLTHVASDQSLTGGDVLPGFELPLAKLFERVQKPKRKK